MSKEEPAWKAELRTAIDEEFGAFGAEMLDLVQPHIRAAEQRGRVAQLAYLEQEYEAHSCKSSGSPSLRLPCEHTASVSSFLRYLDSDPQ